MGIVWTREALERLMEIEGFVSKDSPERAARFVDQLVGHAEKVLSDRPRVGRIVPEISDPSIRELIFMRYRIVYRLKERRVEILTVFEGHRLLRMDEIGV